MKNIRELLQSLHRQDIQTYYQQRSKLESEIKILSKKLSEQEKNQEQLEQWKQQISIL